MGRREATRVASFTLVVVVSSAALLGCSGGPSQQPSHLPAASIAVASIADVEQLAPPTQGGGVAPRFEWRAIEGAASYRLFVLDAEGKPLWAWQGTATDVWMGGLAKPLPDGEAGPRVTPGATWSVAALDQHDHILAVSVLRPITP